jgi:glycosyltransferase involved in cell wall biosynthesis
MRSILLFHPTGPPFVQQTARALDEAGRLRAMVTTFAYQPGGTLGRVLRRLPGGEWADRQLQRRRVSEVGGAEIITHPLPEIVRVGVAAARLGPIALDLAWELTERWFDRLVARRHLRDVDAVYGYEHAALRTFESQRARGGVRLYEMPICHHRTLEEILEPEYARFPEVRTPYDIHLRRMAPRRNRRKDAELRLADLVVTNSTFSRESLLRAGVPDDRVVTVPLAAPPVVRGRERRAGGPFVFLSAGTQSVRKGVHYLLEAWRRLAPGQGTELWLVGTMQLPARVRAGLPGTVRIHPPVPRAELFDLYRRADVLAFPSLCEGFGLVITEAMAHGLPVITTPNTAGRDLIEHRRNGLLVPIRDPEALAEAMAWCLGHRAELADIGREAARTAAAWQWDDYRRALAKALVGASAVGSTSTVSGE